MKMIDLPQWGKFFRENWPKLLALTIFMTPPLWYFTYVIIFQSQLETLKLDNNSCLERVSVLEKKIAPYEGFLDGTLKSGVSGGEISDDYADLNDESNFNTSGINLKIDHYFQQDSTHQVRGVIFGANEDIRLVAVIKPLAREMQFYADLDGRPLLVEVFPGNDLFDAYEWSIDIEMPYEIDNILVIAIGPKDMGKVNEKLDIISRFNIAHLKGVDGILGLLRSFDLTPLALDVRPT